MPVTLTFHGTSVEVEPAPPEAIPAAARQRAASLARDAAEAGARRTAERLGMATDAASPPPGDQPAR